MHGSPVGMCADQKSYRYIFWCMGDSSFCCFGKCERFSCAEWAINNERNCTIMQQTSVFQYVINDLLLLIIQLISIAAKVSTVIDNILYRVGL